MLIIGSDYHPSVQQIAFVDTETGEYGERRLTHCAEAEQFYRELKQRGDSGDEPAAGIAVLCTRYPDAREVVFHHQLQAALGVVGTGFFFSGS
jgi:hypothetical protein